MYSDRPPGFIVPDHPSWRRRAEIEYLKELHPPGEEPVSVGYCDRYSPNPSADRQAALVLDKRHPDCHACANRNPTGERAHNWCYRCPAGLMHVQLHIYDAALSKDRTLILN